MANQMYRIAVGTDAIDHCAEVVEESRHGVACARGGRGRLSGSAHVIRHDVEPRFEERYDGIPNRLVVGETMDQDDGFAPGIASACHAQVDAR